MICLQKILAGGIFNSNERTAKWVNTNRKKIKVKENSNQRFNGLRVSLEDPICKNAGLSGVLAHSKQVHYRYRGTTHKSST